MREQDYRLIRLHTRSPGEVGPRRGHEVDTLVIHYTATQDLERRLPAAGVLRRIRRAAESGAVFADEAAQIEGGLAGALYASDALSLCLTACESSRQSAWHYCVASERDGDDPRIQVVEMVDPDLSAAHVGRPSQPTNQRSIGIETCYPGPAPRSCKTMEQAAEWYAERGWLDLYDSRRPGPDGLLRWYSAIPDYVYQALIGLCIDLCERYPIRAVVGHHPFAPSRRIDPDPPISLDLLRERLTAATGREYGDRPLR